MTQKSPAWLAEHRRNVFSQNGEDGVLEKILEHLQPQERTGWCVEFGAWDGARWSNTRNLIEHAGYSAVLIEGDPQRFEALKARYAGNGRVVPRRAFVGFGDRDNLDEVLKDTPVPKDFDLLSVDIDGNDYHVWAATSAYRPKVVCIEFNPTIPPQVDFVQPADPALNQGSSLRALARLAQAKGYELASATSVNAFFVRRECFERLGIEGNTVEALMTDTSHVSWIFSGMDGSVFLRGSCRHPWHGVPLRAKQLPFFLRGFPGSFGPIRRALLKAYRALRSLTDVGYKP